MVGVLINFGCHGKLEWKRLVFYNKRFPSCFFVPACPALLSGVVDKKIKIVSFVENKK